MSKLTIDKAIQLQLLFSETDAKAFSSDFQNSVKLGIEALKREKARREGFTSIVGTPLPGETEEVRNGTN